MTDPTFLLLHSPLLGPASWRPLADALKLHGFEVATPRIDSDQQPYWRTYTDRAAEAITDLALDDDDEVILVLHSGAGALAAAIADLSIARIAAIVFVDATLPHDGWTRLDEMHAHDPDFAAGIQADLKAGARYPEWTPEQLIPLVPDEDRCRALLTELTPRTLDFFTEPIPAPSWPPSRPASRGGPEATDAPGVADGPRCAYLRFTRPYAPAAAEAERLGWPVGHIEANHFHALVEPDVVASVILRLIELR